LGEWYCPYCLVRDKTVTRDEQRRWKKSMDEIEAAKKLAIKRIMGTASDESPATKQSRTSDAEEGNATKQFVESFFLHGTATQQQYLSALLADPRARDVLPTQFRKSATAQHNPEPLTYNNQSIDISDPSNYRPNDDTAFHRYTPDLNGGRLRNLDKNNNLIPNFIFARAANKSCLLYANKIKDFVMGLVLTPEQRRTAFWKALCLPQLSKMVKSYGLTTKSMNIGLLVAATYYNQSKEKFVLNFYSALSDEKRQDGGTTATNIQKFLADVFLERREIIMSSLKIIISICDGCSGHYRSGSVCYELMLLAITWNIPIDRIIQAPGHGKCIVDSQSGKDKTLLDLFFDCLVTNPEALKEGLKQVETHEKDEEGLVSLAKVCHDILSDPERRCGSSSNARRAANRKIDERRYFIRLCGEASAEGVKFICGKFAKGDGIRSNYHLVQIPT